ncbi:MAG: aspartate-semialdehyde dehydrogenase, partial [Syntrophomonadaceae bacterium]|nr:aspartate-semialdehyde dehydrogenase [Syntrophomonadaceae bacterium]
STYQAVSGAGIAGLAELKQNVQASISDEVFEPKVFQYPIAFNLIPHIDEFVEAGYTREEMKMVHETRKILHRPDLPIVATTVRVPVYRSHSESINLELEKEADIEKVRALMAEAPGIILQDDPSVNLYPMPLFTSDTDPVYVGRIRKDISVVNGVVLWAVADQIRKGAATNAVQIAEEVIKKNLY